MIAVWGFPCRACRVNRNFPEILIARSPKDLDGCRLELMIVINARSQRIGKHVFQEFVRPIISPAVPPDAIFMVGIDSSMYVLCTVHRDRPQNQI